MIRIAGLFLLSPLFLYFYLKNKKCAYRSRRIKTQTPIVAKPILAKTGIICSPIRKAGICILSNSNFTHREKGASFSKKKKSYPFCKVRFVWRPYYTMEKLSCQSFILHFYRNVKQKEPEKQKKFSKPLVKCIFLWYSIEW